MREYCNGDERETHRAGDREATVGNLAMVLNFGTSAADEPSWLIFELCCIRG